VKLRFSYYGKNILYETTSVILREAYYACETTCLILREEQCVELRLSYYGRNNVC